MMVHVAMVLSILMLSLGVSPAFADLDTAMNRAILKATAFDTARTDKQKLFENRCATIARYVGFEKDTTGEARKYSCDVAGVGIAFYAGADLGKHPPEKVGQYFVEALAKEGVPAKVFIKRDHDYGSSMGFYVNGRSWQEEPVDPLKGTKLLEFLANESKLILFTEGRIQDWMYRPK